MVIPRDAKVRKCCVSVLPVRRSARTADRNRRRGGQRPNGTALPSWKLLVCRPGLNATPADLRDMPRESRDPLASLPVPDFRAMIVTGGGDATAVGAERYVPDLSIVAQVA
jgi:hypothetical protein